MAGVATGWMNKGIGLYQFIKGKKMEEEAGDRPTYQIPKEIESSLSMAQRGALEGLPEEQRSQYIDNLMQMQGAGLSQLSGRKAGLVGAGQIAQAGTQGYRDLLTMDAQQRLQNQQTLMQQNELMAGYRDLAFQTNELDPYQEEINYARALQGAGITTSQTGMAQDEQAFRDVFSSVMGGGGMMG